MLVRRQLLSAGAMALLAPPLAAAPAARGGALRHPVMHWFDRQQPNARDYFGDQLLTTHEGRAVRFYSDLLHQRTVLINVVATYCRGVCNTTTHRLAVVRDALGARFGSEIFFVTVTTDPRRDDAAALNRFARSNGAHSPGWSFVTGPSESLEPVLQQLGHKLAGEHMQFGQLLLGNVPASRWQRVKADASPRVLAERLRDLADGAKPA